MRRIFISSLTIGIFCLGSVAQAGWNQPATEYPSSIRSQLRSDVEVFPFSWGNGQYADVYYPKNYPINNVGWTPQMIDSASCVFVHYHGGSWYGGDTRYTPPAPPAVPTPDQLDLAKVIPTLVNEFVGKNHCIFIGMSYPTVDVEEAVDANNNKVLTGNILKSASPRGPKELTLNDIVGDTNPNGVYSPTELGATGSVFQTFNFFYNEHFAVWKARPRAVPLQLFVGGESAGAYLAQRIAADGRWSVDKSLVAGVPVLNPKNRSFFPTSELEEATFNGDPKACTTQNGSAICSVLRKIYGEHKGGYNSLDLHNYNKNLSLTTFYIANACDDIAEVGAAMHGWFNGVPESRRQLGIHKGFNDAFTGHGHFPAMYSDFLSGAVSGQWVTTGTSLAPDSGTMKYGDKYCGDSTTVRARIRN